MSPNCRVRQVATPLSPWCSVGSMLDQSVVPNGMSLIFMVLSLSFDGAGAADLLLQQQHAVEQRFRRRRTAGHVDIDRHDAVAAAYHRIGIVVVAAAIGAGAHRDHI